MPVNSVEDVIHVRPSLTTIVRAAILSQLKMSTITDTFLQRNGEFARYRSSMIGDVARLCAKGWLEVEGFAVIDWDDVRTSWRSNRKRFDLEVNKCRIEVASSIEILDDQDTNTALNQIIEQRSIIQPVRRTEKDIVLQAYYISDIDPIVYIMGWTLWSEIAQYQSIRYVGGYPRDFWLMPFNRPEARPPRDLVDFLQRWGQ